MMDPNAPPRCKDDLTNPYDRDDPNGTPTNIQIRHCLEDMMMILAGLVHQVANLSEPDDPFNELVSTLLQGKPKKDEPVH